MASLDLLTPHLSKIKIPGPQQLIYKDECVYSFDNPESDTGLYVSLVSFLGFGRNYVEQYFQKTGNNVFVHIKRDKKPIPEPEQTGDGPEKKITRLAIGVEGGFDPTCGRPKFTYTDHYNVVVLPGFHTYPWPNPSLPDVVNKSVQAVIDAESPFKIAEIAALQDTWDGEKRKVSAHALGLKQLDNGVKIPPSGWKCAKCDLTTNLWLNLTDGSVLCGRKFFDGSGGNDHAVEHYRETGFPLAVKLGTITADGKGDVFSYAEDDMVEDPHLSTHLKHFGINVQQLQKTEKSMVELELELNQRSGEWNTLQESGSELRPLCGPALTGLNNLGNTCYINSVVQVLFRMPDFVRRFVDGAPEIFSTFPEDPVNDFNVQTAKLGVGLVSGRYSFPSAEGGFQAGVSPHMYRNLVVPPFPDTEYGCYMAESNKMYERALEMFPAPEPPDEYRHLPALAPRLQHNTLLDEFIFWTFKYEFPQNVVCFLLNMLPDQDYKEHLTRTFVMHYARIPLVLEDAADPDTLSNRVVHMSVQLFSNEALALRCVQQLHLLHVMVLSLRLMMGKILVQNTLHDPDQNFHYVIDCTRRVMKEHCYWPLVSDFNNVLSHKSVALLFLQDDALVDMWFEFLSMLQGMNVNIREVGGHIEFEPSSYYAAFSCELEAAAYPMWSVLSHLTEAEHAPLARRIIAAALTYLQEWLDAVHFTAPHMERSEVMHASFHFPLHRYLAAFLCAGVRSMGVRAADVLPPPDLLALLAVHPLRVQSLFYEILAGVWVRNGLQIKGQAMTYIQANFCNSMVDMDIYWLQVCAAHLPADQFLDMCIDMFGCREWLSMLPMLPSQAAEQDAMVEGLLTFLAILVSSRTNLGNDELTQSRLEVSTLLAAGDKTHSQLLELMPERSGNAHTRNFETVLKELSTYRPPPKGSENLEQGLFVPKPIVWEQYYDPLHVLRRAVHRRDFHASMERFSTYVREKQKGAAASAGAAGAGALARFLEI